MSQGEGCLRVLFLRRQGLKGRRGRMRFIMVCRRGQE
nr:MAG TPA: hypothetical protein [Caudoviricetes sp.]